MVTEYPDIKTKHILSNIPLSYSYFAKKSILFTAGNFAIRSQSQKAMNHFWFSIS